MAYANSTACAGNYFDDAVGFPCPSYLIIELQGLELVKHHKVCSVTFTFNDLAMDCALHFLSRDSTVFLFILRCSATQWFLEMKY
ncbi:hypothetical protein CCP3SC5AM1_680007 [Gammaproteobacteria bacterium]